MTHFDASRPDEWTDAEVDQLTALVISGTSHKNIAIALGRTAGSVHGKISRIGLWLDRPASPWTAETEAALREMWADGITAGNIGLKLGVGRNAVLGKVHRLKLTPRVTGDGGARKIRDQERAARRAANGGKPPRSHRLNFGKERGKSEPPKPQRIMMVPPAALRLTILQLTDATCRWPLWQNRSEPYFYCGAHTDAGPYCWAHAKMAVS